MTEADRPVQSPRELPATSPAVLLSTIAIEWLVVVLVLAGLAALGRIDSRVLAFSAWSEVPTMHLAAAGAAVLFAVMASKIVGLLWLNNIERMEILRETRSLRARIVAAMKKSDSNP